jgi:signal transduction histidine kinase
MIPLTVLQGHLARLASNASSDGSSVVGAAMGEAHYIGALVHNLAIAAKLESGAPSPERHLVDLPALVARVVARHRPIARGLSVALDAATPTSLSVLGDETMLEQAVSNLVHNAIRYNRPGGHVAIVLEASRPAAPGAFSLSVIDDGPGVSDDVLERLRERGFRGDDARNRAPGGHGLGLDITSRVARLHHMRLDLRRSEFGGLHAELIAPDAATTPESGTV